MYNDMYKIVSNKSIFKLPKYIIIILVILLILLIFILNYKVCLYDSYDGIITKIGEEYYVKVYMELDKSFFLDNNQIYIDNNLYNYDIYKIEGEPKVIGNNLYLDVYLNIDLEENKKINNYPLIIKQEKKNEKIFKTLLTRIREELNL